jgi:integrase
MDQIICTAPRRQPWNKGKLVGQKAPLKLKEIWAIRVRLQLEERLRELAMFNLAIDSKLRSCDLVKLRVRDVCHGDRVATRAIVMQQKTQRPVQFEITEQTRESVVAWIHRAGRRSEDYLFPSRLRASPHISTRQYARVVRGWVRQIGLDASAYSTHTMRRTKASLIYKRTKNLRVVQLLLGHSKLESTVRYLGIEVDDALEIAEQTEV